MPESHLMASRKAKPPSPQLGLGLPSHETSVASQVLPDPVSAGSPLPTKIEAAVSAPAIDLESFDDYDDGATIDGTPRLRLADPPRDAPSVIVEAIDDGHFEVSRLRDNGTTVANVRYTRKELEELVMRAQAALEMG